MTARSSSGTGIIVSLVVFVLTSVFLLILSIVFYAGKREAEQKELQAQDTLDKYATRAQRNDDAIKHLADQVNSPNESVVKLLIDQQREVMGYLSGNPTDQLETVSSEFERQYKVTRTAGGVKRTLEDSARALRSFQGEVDGLKASVAQRDQEITDLEGRITTMEQAHRQELETVKQDLQKYAAAVEEYQTRLQEVQSQYYAAIDQHRDQYEGRISDLQDANDRLNIEAASLRGRVAELQEIISQTRPQPGDPALLVDGRIIEAAGGGQVFIDRGRKNHIVLGMTFEVYDDEAALLQIDRVTGELPRGKASLQVTKVADATSTCKITRSVPGRPVVRDDVIANAVYDPAYRFKFLVHGQFDLNGDGRPSETEAEHVRDLIVQWGGEVVRGDELTGDLDFLVLGAGPPMPAQLRENPSATEMEIWVGKKREYDRYHELFRQAREARIPVLNANRFFILTGDTGQ